MPTAPRSGRACAPRPASRAASSPCSSTSPSACSNRASDVLAIVQGAGQADADLAALWREGEGRRRSGFAPVVRQWKRQGVLRDHLTERQALDVLWVLTGAATYRSFVVESGWPVARYREWLTASLQVLLFR